MKSITYYLGVGILCLFLTSGCKNDGESVAKLNNDSISTKEFYEYLLTKSTAKVNFQGQAIDVPLADTLGYQALEELIAQQALLQTAEESKITATKEEIDKELEFRKKINSKFVTELSNIGFSVPQIEKKIKLDIIKEKLITKGVNVSLAEAEEYIKKNPEKFTEPASANLRWILLSDLNKKSLVDQELKNGQPFVDIALKYSQYPRVKQDNGVFPQRVIKSMPPQIQTAIDKLKAGQTTDWIKLDSAIAKFYIESKSEQHLIKMDDVKKELLRRELAIKKGSEVNNLQKKILDKLKGSKIEVPFVPLQNAKKKLEERLKGEQEKINKADAPK